MNFLLGYYFPIDDLNFTYEFCKKVLQGEKKVIVKVK